MELFPHQRPPEGDWIQWSIWGDRGCGKTAAATHLMRDWGSEQNAGKPLRILVASQDYHTAIDQLIKGPAGLDRICEGRFQFNTMSLTGVFVDTGALVVLSSARDLERKIGNEFDRLVVDNLDNLGEVDRDSLARVWAFGSKFARRPQTFYSFHRPPPWPLGRLSGPGKVLTLVDNARVNTSLPESFFQ